MGTKGPREKKQEVFVKVFRFCLPVPISSNDPHFTLCFLNKDYLHPSGVELQRGTAGSYRSPISISPAAECSRGSGTHSSPCCPAWFSILRCAVLCSGTRTQSCGFCALSSTVFLSSISAGHTAPARASTCLWVTRPGKSPERLLSFNWELFSSWGFCLRPQGHAVAVPLSVPAVPAAGFDPMSLLPSSASDQPALSLRASPENPEEE